MSAEKSWWPGVSSTFTTWPRYSNCIAELVIEMPRSCSIAIQSEVASLPPLRFFTMPAVRSRPL